MLLDVALVTPVKVVAVFPVYVKVSLFSIKVPVLPNCDVSLTVIVPEAPVIPVPEAIAASSTVASPVPTSPDWETSEAVNDVLKTVGALFPSATISLSLPSKLNLSKVYTPALVLPLSRSVQDPLPAEAVNIFSPLAATIVSLNIQESKTSSVDALVCGTTLVLYLAKPFIRL